MSEERYAERRKKNRGFRRLLFLVLFILLGIGIWYYIDLHTVKDKNVVVTGNVHYTAEQIKEMVMVDKKSSNTLYLSLVYKNKDKPIKDVPFIASMTVKVTAPDAIWIDVKEKTLVGYISFLGENVYFDDKGVVMEITDTYTAGIPEITGILAERVVMGEALPVKDPSIFGLVLEITKTLGKYKVYAQKIHFDENRNITVYVGDIRFYIGDETYLNEKFERIPGILASENMAGKKGVVDLRNVDGTQKATVIFTPDGE